MHGNKQVSNKSLSQPLNQSINKALNIKSEVIKNCDTNPNLISKWKGAVSNLEEAANIIRGTKLNTCYVCTIKESFNVSLVIEIFEIKRLYTSAPDPDIIVSHDNDSNILIRKIGDFFIPISTVKMYTPDSPIEFCMEVIDGLNVKLYLSYS